MQEVQGDTHPGGLAAGVAHRDDLGDIAAGHNAQLILKGHGLFTVRSKHPLLQGDPDIAGGDGVPGGALGREIGQGAVDRQRRQDQHHGQRQQLGFQASFLHNYTPHSPVLRS